MSGKHEKRKRRITAFEREHYRQSLAQHVEDIAWFAAHPDAIWRVRPRVPTECDHAPESTHLLVVYDRVNDQWIGKPLYARDDADAYDQGARELAMKLCSIGAFENDAS